MLDHDHVNPDGTEQEPGEGSVLIPLLGVVPEPERERDSLALPALFTAFAAAAIASGLNRDQSAVLLEELKGFPLPESTEQAFSQMELAIGLVKNRG